MMRFAEAQLRLADAGRPRMTDGSPGTARSIGQSGPGMVATP